MVVSGLLVSLKIAQALAKDMVNLGIVKKTLSPNLLVAGKQWILESLKQRQSKAEQQQHQLAASTEYLVHNWLEALFAWFQVIVLWHEPDVSLCALTGLLSSFLLLTYFAPRFYATIMIALFIYNLNKFWFRHVWPEIRVPPQQEREDEMRLDVDRWTYLHPHLMTLSEFGKHIKNLIIIGKHYLQRLLSLRRKKPIAFCLFVCSTLSCTAFIGDRISGTSLFFLATTALLSAPGIYLHLMPLSVKHWLQQHINQLEVLRSIREASESSSSSPSSSDPSSTKSPSSSSVETLQSLANLSTTTASSARTRALLETPAMSMLGHLIRKSFLNCDEPVQVSSTTPNVDHSEQSEDVDLNEDSGQPLQPVVYLDQDTMDSRSDQECRKGPSASDLSAESEDDQQDDFVFL